MLRLRPHHLNCIPRFQGRGYSDEFCENMNKIKARFDSKEEYKLVFGADDVCRCCPNLINGVCKDEAKVSVFDKLSISEKDISKICSSCQWYSMCKKL